MSKDERKVEPLKTSPGTQTTVYVVDDDTDMCQSIRWLLESVELNVECFNSATDFIAAYNDQMVGCIILDARMPQMSGLELQQKLNQLNSLMPILFLTGHGDAPMAVQAMKAGAMDFLAKPYNGQTLLDKTHRAIELAQTRFQKQKEQLSIKKRIAKLTPREKQVMMVVITGAKSRDIGDELEISHKTVELHRARIMDKMQVRTTVALATLIANYTHNNPGDTSLAAQQATTAEA